MSFRVWEMVAVGEPLRAAERDLEPAEGQVLVEVAGCGVCHTDLGFLYDGVPTRHPLPLVLGHEISGKVVGAGAGAEDLEGVEVIVPAVMPCGECEVCLAGRGAICPKQIFPGNDLDGGFASHVIVPAKGLCKVPDLTGKEVGLADLSVIADAVTTPYQSILRSGLVAGDLAIFVGIGGVGGFGVQIAAAMGATVVAIDVDDAKLASISDYGATLALNAKEYDGRALKKTIRSFAKENGLPATQWKIFETSGTPAGQNTAFGLVNHGAYLGVVGFTPAKVELRLSNLMAFDAVAQGNWGCLPEHYPAVVDMVLDGKVKLTPFVEHHGMDEINDVLPAIQAHEIGRRVVLVP